MSFKITIINNEDGEILVNEENAKVILGAITTEEHTACLAHTASTIFDVLNALDGVDSAKKALLESSPALRLANAFREKAKGDSDGDETSSIPKRTD